MNTLYMNISPPVLKTVRRIIVIKYSPDFRQARAGDGASRAKWNSHGIQKDEFRGFYAYPHCPSSL
jgi:hypothetical protein